MDYFINAAVESDGKGLDKSQRRSGQVHEMKKIMIIHLYRK